MLVSTSVTVASTNKTGPSQYSMGPTDPVTLPTFFSRNNTVTSMKMYILPAVVATINAYRGVYPAMNISSPLTVYTVDVKQPRPVAVINKSSPVGFYDINVKENLISKYKKYIPTYTTTSTASVPLNANTTKIMVNGVIDGTAFGTVRNPFTIVDPIAATVSVTLGGTQHFSLTNRYAVECFTINVANSSKLPTKQRVEINGFAIQSSNNLPIKYTGITYSPSLSFTFYSRYSLSDSDFYYKPVIDTRLLLQKNNDPRYVPLKTLYGIKAGNYYRGGETPPSIQRLI